MVLSLGRQCDDAGSYKELGLPLHGRWRRAQQAERVRRISMLMAFAEGDREGQAWVYRWSEL